MLTICLKDITYHGKHGCTAEEKFRLQPIVVDVKVETNLLSAIWTDVPADTIDWTPIRGIIESVVTGESCNTVERLACKIAVAILRSDERALGVSVTVAKPEEWEDRIGTPGVIVHVTRKGLAHL